MRTHYLEATAKGNTVSVRVSNRTPHIDYIKEVLWDLFSFYSPQGPIHHYETKTSTVYKTEKLANPMVAAEVVQVVQWLNYVTQPGNKIINCPNITKYPPHTRILIRYLAKRLCPTTQNTK